MSRSVYCNYVFVNLQVHLLKMREDHLKFSSELARYSNEVTTTYSETPRTDPENKALANLALRGLQLLSAWTSVVTELYSWKLLHPTDHHQVWTRTDFIRFFIANTIFWTVHS